MTAAHMPLRSLTNAAGRLRWSAVVMPPQTGLGSSIARVASSSACTKDR